MALPAWSIDPWLTATVASGSVQRGRFMTTPSVSPSRITTDLAASLFAIAAEERLARDTNDWASLERLYWPGARVRVTWFDGDIEDLVARSRESVRPGAIGGFHSIVPVRAELDGDRALVESRGEILLRPRVNGVECDLTSWCRFVMGMERCDGEWRISWFDNIYVKDRVDPVLPGVAVEIDRALWEGLRPSYRWLAYTNSARGIDVPADLPGVDRPDLIDDFWRDSRGWLAAPGGV
tara:strand:+ start:15136 stop:15846 length:711 start_codon:yes stop_codon:yes gene_type:complete